MIILIIASLLYIAGVIRKKLKKETIEVEEVLYNNLNNLEKIIDKEMTQLKKTPDFTREKVKMKLRLKNNIEATKKKILKEIKDVEDILR